MRQSTIRLRSPKLSLSSHPRNRSRPESEAQRLDLHIQLRQSDFFCGSLIPAAERGGRADNKNAQNFVRHGEYTDRTYGRRVETKGTVSGVDFTLRRGDNGLPQSLEIPKALLTAEFRNVSPK